MKANAHIYLDSRPKKDGTRLVKIRITFNRKQKYYPTDVHLMEDEFEKVMFGKKRTREQKKIKQKLEVFYNKADKIIDNLKVFTFQKFEDLYSESRDLLNTIQEAYAKRIEHLRLDNKINTAITYECAINSLDEFILKKYKKKTIQFADISPELLKKYERFMLDNGRSTTTISMYLRTLRAMFNSHEIDKSIYPFGKDKYQIPNSRNIKKALTIEEIGQIYNYEAKPNSPEDKAKDYWLFLYLCNGMNVVDFCSLRWSNINNDTLTFERAKTKTTNKERKLITVYLKPEIMAIIKKWGQLSTNKDLFVFPHFNKEMDAEQQRRVVKQLTKNINKYIKRIAIDLGINRNVTTYYARHSFATILQRSGADISMISDLLGHSSVSVTEGYLDGFEKEQIQEKTNALTLGFNKAN